VRHAWIAGEQIVRDRELVRRPFAEIRSDYSATYESFWARVAKDKNTRDVA
jgi:5-methylthioadenosine/S-adenosylhomocysteine deaminase